MSDPLPVLLCGKSTTVATTVIASLKPEYEVIHLILTPESGISDLPRLLQGVHLPPTAIANPNNIGTKNYSKKPVAVITGAGYDTANVADMRVACKRCSNVPWLRPDTTTYPLKPGPGYGEALVERLKVYLKELITSGKMEEDGEHFF